MSEAYIVDALRTPTGKRRGGLSHIHAADLGAHAAGALVERNMVPAEDYDDVIFGCIDAVGPHSQNIARTSWLAAGLPLRVPGVTVDRQCGSSQQALHFAAQAVMSGTQDVILVGGVQTMSQVPLGSASAAGKALGHDTPFARSERWKARFGEVPITQFRAAELIAAKWGISRARMEEFALQSHQRALAAQVGGFFEREILPTDGLAHDETVRRTTLADMAALAPLADGGAITAALASQNGDGAAALLVVSERALKRYDLVPRARIHHMSVLADDPIMMLTAPIPATLRALERTGLTADDIDLVEINEAFAPVVLAWLDETRFPADKVNVNGGALALAHPLGATGAKLMTTLLHELERRKGRYGLQTMCEAGGVANVTIIERLG
ncbi:acetyl-CoA C-acetyltransferase [Mesorhizobium sp. ANAO-SY3R2]|uniref:acetyl-CoA C-acetyltransferase n=1 Tax=Mesorhizobium sp. ANAO-SY3R2 TaxID=3166644 RepID=UPI00366CC6E8